MVVELAVLAVQAATEATQPHHPQAALHFLLQITIGDGQLADGVVQAGHTQAVQLPHPMVVLRILGVLINMNLGTVGLIGQLLEPSLPLQITPHQAVLVAHLGWAKATIKVPQTLDQGVQAAQMLEMAVVDRTERLWEQQQQHRVPVQTET